MPANWNMVSRSHGRPAAVYVIAQQYSSVTFVSMEFYSRKKKRRAFQEYHYLKF
jgi:hypothetical protein